MDSNFSLSEINVFLGDISHHLKNNLQSFDYQNTFKNSTELSNEELESRKLLERCEKLIYLLKYLTNNINHCPNCNCNKKNNIKENIIEDQQNVNGINNLLTRNSIILENDEDSSYLDMSGNRRIKDNEYIDFNGPSSFSTIPNSPISEINAPLSIPTTTNFNNTFHSTRSQKKNRTTTSMIECFDSDSDKDLYDICNISSDQLTDRQLINRRQTTSFPLHNTQTNNNHHQRSKSMEENEPILDCPYIGLPAAHLQIHKSPKFGQLIRIEKRLFFDQTKKYYCGILNDWLLCYTTDGTTIINNNNNNNSNNNINTNNTSSQMRPIVCIQLSGTEIEHYGEGKRRDLCFQIINPETNKKFIFQSLNEIDTKEWIHAIEASIRGDFYIEKLSNKLITQNCNNNNNNNNTILDSRSNSSSPKSSIHISFNNSLRKLPTPPITQNKCNFISLNESGCNQQCEDIYEEPSTLYNHDIIYKENNDFSVDSLIIQTSDELPPDIPIKLGKLKLNTISNDNIEYDIPKCQYNKSNQIIDKNESVNSTLLPITIASTSKSLENTELLDSNSKTKTEFQIKIKDVHNKLTNQFTKAAAAATNNQNNDDKLKKMKKSVITNNNESKSLLVSNIKQNGTKKTVIKTPNKTTNNQKPISPINNTPVKNWFLNRLNKTGSIHATNGTKITPIKTNDKEKKLISNLSESENLLEIIDNDNTDFNHLENINNKNVNDNSKFINDIPAQKGGKVNRIINQLEANGHLPIFTQQNYDRFNAALLLGGNNLLNNDNDDCNYEPIMASNK